MLSLVLLNVSNPRGIISAQFISNFFSALFRHCLSLPLAGSEHGWYHRELPVRGVLSLLLMGRFVTGLGLPAPAQ
jgi:hypothetical protein